MLGFHAISAAPIASSDDGTSGSFLSGALSRALRRVGIRRDLRRVAGRQILRRAFDCCRVLARGSLDVFAVVHGPFVAPTADFLLWDDASRVLWDDGSKIII